MVISTSLGTVATRRWERGTTQIELDGGAFTVAPFNPQIDARFAYGADDVVVRRD
jgi:hypothetical protein